MSLRFFHCPLLFNEKFLHVHEMIFRLITGIRNFDRTQNCWHFKDAFLNLKHFEVHSTINLEMLSHSIVYHLQFIIVLLSAQSNSKLCDNDLCKCIALWYA